MVRDYRRAGCIRQFFLENNMTAFLADKIKAAFLQDFYHLVGGNDRQFGHALDRDVEGGDERTFGWRLNLGRIRVFQKKLYGFKEILPGFFDGVPLAGDVKLRAYGDVPLSLFFNNCRKAVGHRQDILPLSLKTHPEEVYHTYGLMSRSCP